MSRARVVLPVVLGLALAATRLRAQEQPAPEPAPPVRFLPPAASSAPPAPSASAAPSPEAPPPAEGNRSRLSFRAGAGYQHLRFQGVPINGGRLRLAIGSQEDKHAHYGGLSFLYGRTTGDLNTFDIRGGWTGDILRRTFFRFGFDLEIGYLTVRRVTASERVWSWGTNAGAHATIDVPSFGPKEDHALFLEGRVDAYLHLYALMWSASISAGLRY